jgi:uncharacterized membrane protein
VTYETMKGRILKHKRVWMVAAVVVLVAGHGAFLHYISSHVALSTAMVSGVIILVAVKLIVIKHRGASSPLRTLSRRWSRH